MAIDAAGVVRVAAAAARSRAAGLALVSGFCFRRDAGMVDLVARIHDGAIGRPELVQAHAAIGLPWRKPVESAHAAGDWPLRNWISFARFSGGHFVDQHVQAIDRAVWIMGDVVPLTAEPMPSSMPRTAMGPGGEFGGSTDRDRDDDATGAIGDCVPATAVRYTFADGRTIGASIDRRERAGDRMIETVAGSEGTCDLLRGTITGRRVRATVATPGPGRFPAAMMAMVGGILSGRVAHDGDTMCRSTLVAVMGRMAAASDRPVGWSELPGCGPRLA